MRRILVAASLLVALATNAHALENSLAGDWTLSGADTKGKYTGTATVVRQDDGRYSIVFSLDYGANKSGKAFFLGTTTGTTLDGDRGEPNGFVGALANAPKNAVAAHYKLSDDGTTLSGEFGNCKETLKRTLAAKARIVILHTNDVHGQVFPLKTANGDRGGYAALVARLRKERAAVLASGASVLTLDAGDIYAGTPEGDGTHGIVDLECMKLAGFDAMSLGNHEFDQSVPIVKELCGRSAFPILAANLIDEGTKKLPAWKGLAGSLRLNVGGLKVCVVGLLTKDLKKVTTNLGSKGVDCEDEVTAARRELEANADAQVNIIVSHVGGEGDQAVATAFAGKVAAIVGGHTHETITAPKRFPDSEGVLITQAGKAGQYIGRIDIEIDRATGKVTAIAGKLIAVNPSEGVAADVSEAIEKSAGEITAKMDKVLGSLARDLPRKGAGSTPLGNFLTDQMRRHAHADVAIYNKTGIRGELAKGDVTLRDIFQVVPFADHNVVMTLTGADLLKVCESSLAPTIGSPPALEISGMVVKFDLSKPAWKRVRSVTVNGIPLDKKKKYRVVTGKFLSEGGDGHTAFTKGTDLADEGGTLMDALQLPFTGNLVDPGQPEKRWVADGGP